MKFIHKTLHAHSNKITIYIISEERTQESSYIQDGSTLPHIHYYIIQSEFTDSTTTTTPSSWTILSTLLQIDGANLQGHVVPTQDVATTSCKFDVRNGGNNLCEKGSGSWWFRLLKSDPNPFHTFVNHNCNLKFNTTPKMIANHIKPQ